MRQGHCGLVTHFQEIQRNLWTLTRTRHRKMMEHGLTCLAVPTEDLANGSQVIDLGKSSWEFREESPCLLPWTGTRKGQHKFAAFTNNWKLLRFLERCFCWDAFLSSFQGQGTVRRLECSMRTAVLLRLRMNNMFLIVFGFSRVRPICS